MKLVKILFSIVLLIVVVAAIAFACLTMLVDPNKLKPVLANEVLKSTGYELKIDGNLSWSFFPRLGVKVEHMTLNEPHHPAFIDLRDVTIASEIRQLLQGTQKLQGELHIGSVRLFNLQLSEAYVGLHWLSGMATFEPIKANLYNGTLKGIAHGRTLSVDPHWDWSMQANNVQLKPLLQDVNGAASKIVISGVGDVSMTAETHGKAKAQIFKNLNGISEFSITKGALEGIDINHLVDTANAVLNGSSVTGASHLDYTSFQSFTGVAAIKEGVATINNLMLVSPALTTTGIANIDLNTQRIECKLQMTPLRLEKMHWTIPVLVQGDLHNPSVQIDGETLKVQVANEQFQKVKSKVAEEVKKLPEKADKLIKKFLGT